MVFRPARLTMWAIAALLLVAIVLAFRPQPVPVDVAVVERGSLRVTIDAEGVTRVRDSYVLSAPVASRLLRIDLEPGDAVSAGKTTLATFLPVTSTPLDARTRAEAEARMKAAQAGRDQAQVALEQAREEQAYTSKELQRQRDLLKAGAITEERLAAIELDARASDTKVRAAELALRGAEYELDAARALLQQVANPIGARGGSTGALLLRSPIDGVVLRRHHESEALVSAGERLIEVGDLSKLEIVADLLSSDAVRVRPGFAVSIERWGGETTLRGRVRLIEPSGFTKVSALGVEEQRVNAIIDLTDAVPQGHFLGDGYRVEVSVVIWERDGVIKVPTSSLFRLGEEWAVFGVRDEKAVRLTVQVGERNATEAEVVSGLAQGDQVIVHPGDSVEDGVSVTLRVP